MKCSFFQAAVVSVLLYGCTTWTLTKCLEKKIACNYTKMLRAILNKSWRQHTTKHQLYGYLPPITKTIQVRRTRHAGHCWKGRDELISDVLLWTPSYGRTKAGQPTQTYIQQLCEDTVSHRYPWCNGYRRRKWTRRHKFKSWTRLVAFHIALIPLEKVWIQLFSFQQWVNSRADWFFSLGEATSLGEGKLWKSI